MQQCVACGGVYRSVLVDGTEYYHVCPPLSVAELRAALDAKTFALDAATQRQLDAETAIDKATPPKPGDPVALDRVLARLTVPRPNARNENIDVAATRAARRDNEKAPAVILSAGAGVVTG